MTVSERLRSAASTVLAGDESVLAAQNLEAVLLDEYLDDDRTSALLEGLAHYAPGSGSPYVDPPELRRLVQEALVALASSEGEQSPCG